MSETHDAGSADVSEARIRLEPWDEHNRRLVAQVHPDGWLNPVPASRYNLVVLGGGTAGLVTAAAAAGLGAKVALIERRLLGGDCLNVGCVPSKALLASAREAAARRSSRNYGLNDAGLVQVDFAAVMERMRRLRADLSPHDSAARFRGLGVDVFLGHARFAATDQVEVGGARLHFAKAVIATGARPAVPNIPGLREIPYLTHETVFSLTERPRRMAVIGAGPIGCEMAQAFARLGSEVCLVETAHGILSREDPDAAEVVRGSLQRDGVRIMCCGKDLRLSREGTGEVRLHLESHGQRHDVAVDALLVATGRVPNLEGMGLETGGIAFDSKGVQVNDHLRTTNRRVYACGDVCSRQQFTHAADFQARLVVRNALFLGRSRASRLLTPRCTYTFPEVAHVETGLATGSPGADDFVTLRQDFATVDRAVLDGHTEGFVKVRIRKGSDRLVSATVVGPHAGDLMAELVMAMQEGIGLARIANIMHPYPTYAEAIRRIGDTYNRTRLTPGIRRAMSFWMALARR